MRILFSGQVPKDLNYPAETEDVFDIAIEAKRFAISDGASESFDSRTWANLLVRAFTHSPGLSAVWLSEIVDQYSSQIDKSILSWSKHASYERGSFATLLGVEESPSQYSVNVQSIGDSLAVLLTDGERYDSFPYHNSQEFQQRPELFCTKSSHNEFISDPEFSAKTLKTWCFENLKQPTLLCMTDALGEWALNMEQKGDPQWATLLSIAEPAQLEAIVVCEREKGLMRVDDVTLVSVSLGQGEPDGLSDA